MTLGLRTYALYACSKKILTVIIIIAVITVGAAAVRSAPFPDVLGT